MASGEDGYIGKQIGGAYRLIAKINSGAYGSVYQAQHLIFDDDPVVAIKLLRGLVITEQERQSFFQEARLLRKLRHPHVLPILDAGIQDETPYIVMEYASGGSLKDRLLQHPGQPLPENEALSILKQIGEALHYAHTQSQPIVHRDLKPDNILFNIKGEVLLADFGIAAILSSGTKDLGRGGTPAYMAPEQFQGMVSTRSDQYALGCIAYELLTGRPPYDLEGASMEVVWYHHTKVIPTTPKQYNPGLSDNVAKAILTALAKDRTARHADVPAFIAALSTQKTANQCIIEGNALFGQKKYEEALRAYEEAIRLNPNYAIAHGNKGLALSNMKKYEEALMAYEEAIRLNPNDAFSYNGKGDALNSLGRYEEALEASEEATRLNPRLANAHVSKGTALRRLGRHEEALKEYEQSIQLSQNYAEAYVGKGNVLNDLGRCGEAVSIYEEAIRLNPNYALAYNNKGVALSALGRKAEAQQAYQKARELGYKG